MAWTEPQIRANGKPLMNMLVGAAHQARHDTIVVEHPVVDRMVQSWYCESGRRKTIQNHDAVSKINAESLGYPADKAGYVGSSRC